LLEGIAEEDIVITHYDATDDVRARFAELFDLYATIRPDSSRGGYHFDLVANIPLEIEGDKPGAYDMVFSPSGRTFRENPLSNRIILYIRFYLFERGGGEASNRLNAYWAGEWYKNAGNTDVDEKQESALRRKRQAGRLFPKRSESFRAVIK
jgi:hypothetical protein